MQGKWLEDFLLLAQERSFTRAAELRHVTHPAFGRRIRALEAWAGTPLIEPGGGPVRLTPAGEAFRDTAEQLVRTLAQSHDELQAVAGRQARVITLATGRTLARTIVADWLTRHGSVLQTAELRVVTRTLDETVAMLQRGEVSFTLVYHHAAIGVRLDGRQFSYLTVMQDRLVPVARADARGRPMYELSASHQPVAPVPYLAFSHSMALGRLVEDHLARHPLAPRLRRCVDCDSADAHYEYVLRGLGLAWMPWSMVRGDCQAGRLAVAGDPGLEVHFDVRLYRPKRHLGPAAEQFWSDITGA
ncbi:LysR substrate-binding domain-containing protein [Delftia tsuruhatensis]|uniref:LysR family transcriptional regulator n=1 Tax=Delftia tsuruhatensis TaxID=180282 RepID=A0ABN4SJ91_9BURK|nr:LysR substrate-binding domain-containing protein [Delftia tsuruhatensis]AOV03572.1 LysR family transcriptional regulator [Delftia tsuruhatensis]MDH2232518.1 LysR substrate-binding domain-containing protein [Delftia tsuruhatensis]